MSTASAFEEAASHLRLALENNKLATLQTSDFRIFINDTAISDQTTDSERLNVTQDLLASLCSGQLNTNNQIVAATAYCKTVSSSFQEFEETLEFFTNLLSGKEFQESTLFICHGILQLGCWTVPSKNGNKLLEEIFRIVQKFCCDLTSTCYFAFKILHGLLAKVHELYPNGAGISEKNFKAVLDIILSNWENPLNGVRQQNSLALNELLLFDQVYWNEVLAKAGSHTAGREVSNHVKHECLLGLTLAELPWTMKSKYFLLLSIVKDSNVSQILIKHGEDIIDGIVTSLSIPYLVSAGTDLYLALLASLSLEDWQQWFLKTFKEVFSQHDPSLEVENLFSYWMNQTLKKFPVLFEDFIGDTKESLFSYITLLKIGRKEGFIDWKNVDEERLRDSVEHHSDKIRSQVISLICTSSKTSSSPSDDEYGTIQRFLKQNINSDNPSLRQNLLKSVTDFILRIRDVLLFIFKNKNDSSLLSCNSPWDHCSRFLTWLHSFLLFNLKNKCNYQRKITSLEIYRIVLSYFGEEKVKDKSYRRKSNKDHLNLRKFSDVSQLLSQFESEEDKKALLHCLFDEDNSIRSSAATCLMTYYQVTEANKTDFEMLFKRGLTLASDQMFYKAESGALIIQVLVTLAYKSPSVEFRNMINNGSDSFISVLLNSAEEQFSRLQDDLLKAASQGSFLYGSLQTIELLTVDCSVPELSINENHLERLISLIERVTEYFIKILALKSDSSSGFAPSFGEMGAAIAAVVESSSVKNSEFISEIQDDSASDLQLTPAQQLVLSCVWLNLKECCKLCSQLVSQQPSARDCQRCLTVVVSVLLKCRHKGAIESAGLALYHIANHLTKSDKPELINKPEELLRDFLQMLVDTTAATVSRRSAGLAILVHRLVTGDSRPKKPLLHMCVSRLLSVAEDPDVPELAALVDLPQSQALHLLRTLVQESSLREHMAQYTLSISLVALTNLASPLWTIRNAALQLFGALVPKLVGQKPNQEQDGGSHYLAFEELYTHARPLVEIMLKELTSAAESESTTVHSKLMPLLTLITNLTLGLQTILTDDLTGVVKQFHQCFKRLSGSSIFSVRKLSSKAHALFTTSSRLVGLISETAEEVTNYVEGRDCKARSENELHGYVLNLTHLYRRFKDEKVGMKILLEKETEVDALLELVVHKLLSAQCSYFTKALVFELKYPITVEETVALPTGNSHFRSLGYPYFIDKKLHYAILILSETEVEKISNFCLLNSCYDVQHSFLKALKLYSVSKKDLENHTCRALLKSLKEYLLYRKHNLILVPLAFRVMLPLLEQMKRSSAEHFFCSEFLSYSLNILASNEYSPAVTTAVLPVASALLAVQNPTDKEALLKISSMMKTRSDPDYDQDIRLSAVKSISFLSGLIMSGDLIGNESGELIWKACIDLLQDEIPEIRYEMSRVVSVLATSTDGLVLNPFVSHECIFHHKLGTKFMKLEKLAHCLREKIQYETIENSQTAQISNPFDHGIKTFYVEEKWVSQLALCGLHYIRSDVRDMEEELKQLLEGSLVNQKELIGLIAESRALLNLIDS